MFSTWYALSPFAHFLLPTVVDGLVAFFCTFQSNFINCYKVSCCTVTSVNHFSKPSTIKSRLLGSRCSDFSPFYHCVSFHSN
ncbi:hypothetical protein V3C99_005057 [Haemonchus contortus]